MKTNNEEAVNTSLRLNANTASMIKDIVDMIKAVKDLYGEKFFQITEKLLDLQRLQKKLDTLEDLVQDMEFRIGKLEAQD